jgi:hypothetical protein
MAVTSTDDFAGPFTPDGVATEFPFAFRAASADELTVLRMAADGTTTDLLGYSVNLEDGAGGSVLFAIPPAAGDPIYIVSNPSFEQQATFASQGSFSPKTLTDALDRAAIRDIALLAALDRAPLAPPTETMGLLPSAAARAGQFFAFDVNGDPVVSSGTGTDAGLRTDLGTNPDAIIALIDPAGKPTTLQRHIIRNYIEDISGVVVGSGGDATGNATAINAALVAGGYYHMRPGALYRIGASLILPSNSGLIFEGDYNKPTILMPAANFTNANNSGGTRYGSNAVGINFSGLTGGLYTPTIGVVLENFILQSETNIGRYLRGIAGLNVQKARIYGVEIFGIPTGIGICLSSALHCEIERPYVHDFTDSTNWASLPQSTGIEIDNDLVNSISSLDVAMRNVRIEDLQFTGAALSTWGYQTDGINVANKGARVRVEGGRIKGVGEGIDNFSCDGVFAGLTFENIDQYAWKGIHGASRNQISDLTIRNVGISGILFAGSSQAGQDTEANIASNISVFGIDPNGVWAANDTAGVLLIDNGGTAGKPRNNQVTDVTVDPGSHGKYGYLDSSTGSRNMGHDLDVRDGAALIKRILVQNDSGAASIKTSPAYHTNLDPGTVPVTVNAQFPSTFPYSPGQFETDTLAQGSGARSIILRPGWSGTIKDDVGNAATGNITIQGAPQATGTGSIAIDANGKGILTLTITSGTIYEGMQVTGAGVASNTVVGEWLTGTKGGPGTYRVNKPQTVASTALTFPTAGAIDGSTTQVISTNRGSLRIRARPGPGNGFVLA